MKIIIDNTEFLYDIGCRLIKTKYAKCPIKELKDIWNEINPMTFSEIVKDISNIEQRRIAINCLGIDRLVKEVNPVLIDSQTIKKTTSWIDKHGELTTKKFSDTYELYEVSGNDLGVTTPLNMNENFYNYVKCKDTSTDREYLIWVEADSVYRANKMETWTQSGINYGRMINAIQAIAWTIQTDIRQGGIEKIIRQGDCILIKKLPDAKIGTIRHLNEKEYRELITAES